MPVCQPERTRHYHQELSLYSDEHLLSDPELVLSFLQQLVVDQQQQVADQFIVTHHQCDLSVQHLLLCVCEVGVDHVDREQLCLQSLRFGDRVPYTHQLFLQFCFEEKCS